MLTAAMRSKVDQLWDRLWSGGIANPLTAIEQISYLLFIRRLDALDEKRRGDAEFLKQEFRSLFGGTFTTRSGRDRPRDELRWSRFRHLPPDEMLEHVRDHVFPFIKTLEDGGQVFTRYMHDAVFIIPKASLLVEAVGIIDDLYAELERERQEAGQTFQDVQGDLYEYLLAEIQSAGKNGQFRTPRHIIQLIVTLVDPKLGEAICDPACGTGGFLLGAYQHLLTQHTSPEHRFVGEDGIERGLVGDRLTDPRQWAALKEQTFHGYDFDTTMVRIGLMNLLLHGIERPNLGYMDTLSKRYTETERYDVVLANPPFKGSIDKGDINEELRLKTTKTELLFVNRIINLLRVGGRAGVIVPDGVLFGSSNAHKDLRRMLVEECELMGIVKLPAGVFKPYAGVSTAVLIFAKGGCTEHVWYYDMKADGWSLDDKREKVPENDIPDVIARWTARTQEESANQMGRAFHVPAEVIRGNDYDLSIVRYQAPLRDERVRIPPHLIVHRLRDVEGSVDDDRMALEAALLNLSQGVDFRRVKLGECCEVVSGATPRTEQPEYWNGTIPWATPRDVSSLDGPTLTRTEARITDEGYRSCSTTLLPVGAVLFTSRAPIGLVAMAGLPVCTNQGFKSFIPGAEVDSRYLYWCLRREAARIAARGSGSTFAEVSKSAISRFEIPLPSLSEQQRIAHALDAVEAIRCKRRQSLGLLEDLHESLSQQLFLGAS